MCVTKYFPKKNNFACIVKLMLVAQYSAALATVIGIAGEILMSYVSELCGYVHVFVNT